MMMAMENKEAYEVSMETKETVLKALKNKDFLLSNIYIGLQKSGNEPIVKQPCEFEGIEQYLYIRRYIDENTNAIIKLSESVLKDAEIDTDEAWSAAEINTFQETDIMSMGEMLEISDMAPMVVITNKSKCRGASAILDKNAIKEYFKEQNIHKLAVLPSSIYEMILVPFDELNMSINDLSEMVKMINSAEVAENEQLVDRAYVMEI